MPAGLDEFARMYLAFVNSSSDFRITRFDIDPQTRFQTRRTRILPISSEYGGAQMEVELIQRDNVLFAIEGRAVHAIRLY